MKSGFTWLANHHILFLLKFYNASQLFGNRLVVSDRSKDYIYVTLAPSRFFPILFSQEIQTVGRERSFSLMCLQKQYFLLWLISSSPKTHFFHLCNHFGMTYWRLPTRGTINGLQHELFWILLCSHTSWHWQGDITIWIWKRKMGFWQISLGSEK